MAGYTPLFDSLTKGTLCGKWPDIGLWPIILSLADRHGVVDVTHQYIATITGLEHDQVVACMERFCQPDPHSRSRDDGGARLILLDAHRSWGWRVVNHGKYAEKARLIHKNARDVESGKEAERKRRERAAEEAPADVRRCPPGAASQSQSQSQAQKKTTGRKRPKVNDESEEFLALKAVYPKRSDSQRWADAKSAINARLREGHSWDEILAGARRYAAYIEACGKAGTKYVLQAATFVGPNKQFLDPWLPPKRELSPVQRVLNRGRSDERLVN